jgi:ABC-2 type transport system permease protein
MLAIAGLAGVPYHPTLIITLVAEMLLLAFTLTAFGTMMAIRMKSIQSFMTLMQMIMMPMLMLSGAMFPLSNLPTWLRVMTHINPMTYAVDPMRRAIFDHIAVSLSVRGRFGAGVAWWRWQVPAIVDVGLVAALGLIALGAAVKRFSKPE